MSAAEGLVGLLRWTVFMISYFVYMRVNVELILLTYSASES